MNEREFRAGLDQLGLSQAEAARLLGVKLRTVQRWAAGRPPVAEPAAQALLAWCRMAERGMAWRPGDNAVELEDLVEIARRWHLALRLDESSYRIRAQGGPRRRWRVNLRRCRAVSKSMVVTFSRLADGSFAPASYRPLDGPADLRRDRILIEEAVAAFADIASLEKDDRMIAPGASAGVGPARRTGTLLGGVDSREPGAQRADAGSVHLRAAPEA